MSLLSVNELSITLEAPSGRLELLAPLSFDLEAGRTLGIVGESGSGKSMLALAIMGLLPPSARAGGSVRLEGRELIGLPEAELCRVRGNRIGMIFQEPLTALNPVMTVGEQIAEARRWHLGQSRRQARGEALALMEQVGIPDARRRLDAYPHQLSGGQRQRVGIAIALACRPTLLIADEPTTALDVTVQAQILDLLRGLIADHGMGLIIISHDLGVIAETADDTLVLYAGAAVEQGDTISVFERPAHPYTQGLFAAVPGGVSYGSRLKTIAGTVPEPSLRLAGCPFADRCDRAFAPCAVEPPGWTAVGRHQRARCFLLEEGR